MTKTDAERDAELSAQLKALTDQMRPLWLERKAIRKRAETAKRQNREGIIRAQAEEYDQRKAERLLLGKQALSLREKGASIEHIRDPMMRKGNRDLGLLLSDAASECVKRPSDTLFPAALRYLVDRQLSLPVFDVTEMTQEEQKTLEDALISSGFTITRRARAA